MAKVRDIERVFSNYLFKLKRTGKNFSTNCPFHNDKDPSLSISPDQGYWKCWVCGEERSGDVIEFVKQYRNLSYPEAIEELVKMHGFTYDELGYTPRKGKTGLDFSSDESALSSCASVYTANLFGDNDDSRKALAYLKDRGFNESTIRRWRLGFAPDDKYTLVKKTKRDSPERKRLVELDMIKKDHPSDRFVRRIIFPIRNTSGLIAGFTGRVTPWASDDVKLAKYLNNADTRTFQKSSLLYGLYESINYCQSKRIYIVEGQTDVIGFVSMGQAACASSGTALSSEQIELISKHYNEIVFLFDPDNAGTKALYRIIDKIIPLLIKRIAFFCASLDGKDPHDFFMEYYLANGDGSEGRRAFLGALSSVTRPLSEFLIEKPSADSVQLTYCDTPERIASWSVSLGDFISRLPGCDLKSYLEIQRSSIESSWPEGVAQDKDKAILPPTAAALASFISRDPHHRKIMRAALYAQGVHPQSKLMAFANSYEARLISFVFNDKDHLDTDIRIPGSPDKLCFSLASDIKQNIKKRFAISELYSCLLNGAQSSNASINSKYFKSD